MRQRFWCPSNRNPRIENPCIGWRSRTSHTWISRKEHVDRSVWVSRAVLAKAECRDLFVEKCVREERLPPDTHTKGETWLQVNCVLHEGAPLGPVSCRALSASLLEGAGVTQKEIRHPVARELTIERNQRKREPVVCDFDIGVEDIHAGNDQVLTMVPGDRFVDRIGLARPPVRVLTVPGHT